jgi:hypothetical protein
MPNLDAQAYGQWLVNCGQLASGWRSLCRLFVRPDPPGPSIPTLSVAFYQLSAFCAAIPFAEIERVWMDGGVCRADQPAHASASALSWATTTSAARVSQHLAGLTSLVHLSLNKVGLGGFWAHDLSPLLAPDQPVAQSERTRLRRRSASCRCSILSATCRCPPWNTAVLATERSQCWPRAWS